MFYITTTAVESNVTLQKFEQNRQGSLIQVLKKSPIQESRKQTYTLCEQSHVIICVAQNVVSRIVN
jgi:hypothetical protein